MDQKNILPRGIAKPIEQQPDGTWIVRHHFRVVGTSENGEELVTLPVRNIPRNLPCNRFKEVLTVIGCVLQCMEIQFQTK